MARHLQGAALHELLRVEIRSRHRSPIERCREWNPATRDKLEGDEKGSKSVLTVTDCGEELVRISLSRSLPIGLAITGS